jgi:ribulose-phosphate 3-epimerase
MTARTPFSVKISPSVLAADFGHLADEVKRAEQAGADSLHLDIMDGHFVPNLSFGPQVVAAINRATDLFLDVHLMIYHPFEYIEHFVKAGADNITFHFEATEDVSETLAYIRRCNIRAGLAFNPETSMTMIPHYLDQCDLILIMTVHPGFGGQTLMEEVLEKVKFTRAICDKLNIRQGGVVPQTAHVVENQLPLFDIQVDGGIHVDNVRCCVEAGANIIVSGTGLFQAPNMAQAIKEMREAVR